MGITTMQQAKILIGTCTVMSVLGALMVFLTNFNANGMLLTMGGMLLYEAVVRSEPGQQIFLNQSTILPEDKFFGWILALLMVFLILSSVLELWEFVFTG